ncbi:MAG: hypothetical protein ACHRXM_36010 [Isosphaerales bacterium]
MKSGIKTWTMLSSLVLALAFVTGCNTEETPPESTPKPAVTAPSTVKPADAKPVTPAPSKPDEKK